MFDEFGMTLLISAVSHDAAPIFQIMKILRMLKFLLANKHAGIQKRNGYFNFVCTTNKDDSDIIDKIMYIQ